MQGRMVREMTFEDERHWKSIVIKVIALKIKYLDQINYPIKKYCIFAVWKCVDSY